MVPPRNYYRVRLSALAAGGAFGSGVGAIKSSLATFAEDGRPAAASSLASAARSGSRRGAWGISIAFDDATDCRCYRGQLVGGEVNGRHGPDIIGRHLSRQGEGRHASRRRVARFTDLVAPA
jgi:hypothetical protein